MQGRWPALGGVDHARDGGGPVGCEDGLGGLDLDLEADAPVRQPVRLLELVAQLRHRRDLFGVADLGQRQDEPFGQSPVSSRPVRKMSRVRMPRSRTAASMHFMRMPTYGAAVPFRVGLADQPGGTGRCRVLLGVAAAAVAVLEVDAQVLDGLALQLGAYAVVHRGGELVGEAEHRGEGGGVRGVLVEPASAWSPQERMVSASKTSPARRRCARAGGCRGRPGSGGRVRRRPGRGRR